MRAHSGRILLLAPVILLLGYGFIDFAKLRFAEQVFSLSGFEMLIGDLSNAGKLTPLLPPVRALSFLLLAVVALSMLFLFKKKLLLYAISMLSTAGISVSLLASLSPMKNTTADDFAAVAAPGFTLLLLVSFAAGVAALCKWNPERLSRVIFLLLACTALLSAAAILGFMLVMGLPAIAKIGLVPFLFQTNWNPTANPPAYGIGAMILTTLYATAGATVLAAPVGVLTAIFLAELAPAPIARAVRPAVELLAGIPSVVFGFFGMMVIVPAVRDLFHAPVGDGLLSVIFILAMMILPTVISLAETSLRAVPRAHKEASLGLGATRMQTIFKVILPASRSGVFAGLILGVGRALGETMAVLLVAGNVVNLPGLFKTVRPMTAGIVLEMAYAEGLHREALFAVGLVLLLFILLINTLFQSILRKAERRYEA